MYGRAARRSAYGLIGRATLWRGIAIRSGIANTRAIWDPSRRRGTGGGPVWVLAPPSRCPRPAAPRPRTRAQRALPDSTRLPSARPPGPWPGLRLQSMLQSSDFKYKLQLSLTKLQTLYKRTCNTRTGTRYSIRAIVRWPKHIAQKEILFSML